ncbi:MAG: hypothetical protein R3257_00965, partial [bacterium]|nr:hypothetical protein [bacterium]
MDPAALAWMSAAGLAYQGGRLLAFRSALSRWGHRPTAQVAGALGGFGVEVPAFVATTKGASVALGREVDLSAGAWRDELVGAGLVLGALKLSGWGSHVGMQRLYGKGPAPAITQGVAQQTGMLGGIMGGHYLEGKYHGQAFPGGAEFFSQSLATLFQFNIAGAMLPHLAPNMHRMQQTIATQGSARGVAVGVGDPQSSVFGGAHADRARLAGPWQKQFAWAMGGDLKDPSVAMMASMDKIHPWTDRVRDGGHWSAREYEKAKEEIEELKPKEAKRLLPRIEKGLQHASPRVRIDNVILMAYLATKADAMGMTYATLRLAGMLQDSHPEVRSQAGFVLTEILRQGDIKNNATLIWDSLLTPSVQPQPLKQLIQKLSGESRSLPPPLEGLERGEIILATTLLMFRLESMDLEKIARAFPVFVHLLPRIPGPSQDRFISRGARAVAEAISENKQQKIYEQNFWVDQLLRVLEGRSLSTRFPEQKMAYLALKEIFYRFLASGRKGEVAKRLMAWRALQRVQNQLETEGFGSLDRDFHKILSGLAGESLESFAEWFQTHVAPSRYHRMVED